MAVSKAKPLSFSTTIRNPYRIPNFLRCILPFEHQILTSDIIHSIVKTVIREKEYKPNYVKYTTDLNEIYENPDAIFDDEQLEKIIKMSPQDHKEAGFEKGWDSRFDTWYKMIKEFGMIKYAMNEEIIVTETGHMMVDASLEDPVNEKKIQELFLNALMKYQTNNPLRKNLNDNVPLPLLLSVIKMLHEDVEENGAGIYIKEIPILLCWRNNDAVSLYKYIKSIRKSNKFNYSDEFIYDRCLSILESDNRNYLKMDKICHESVDEYIRKMRMSGVVSLRGQGRFLDINSFETETVDYIIKTYMKYPKFETEDEYIDYMGTIDRNILKLESIPVPDFTDIRKRTLYKFANEMTKEDVKKELEIVCTKNKYSKHDVLKFIKEPTRLEFLTSIALVQNFKGLDVNPNYSVDDEGLPTNTASGGVADIECFDSDYDSYFEVTLMCSRSDQVNNEIIPISRHLQEAKKNRRIESFSVFVAPVVHQDTYEAVEWQKMKYKVDILPYDILGFIDAIDTHEKASQLLLESMK